MKVAPISINLLSGIYRGICFTICKEQLLYNPVVLSNLFFIKYSIIFIKYKLNCLCFQAITGEEESKKSAVKANLRTVAEKKLAVLDRALSKNPSSIILQLEKLELLKLLLPAGEIKKEWGHLTFRHPADVSLWKESLVFSQTFLLGFNVTSAVKSYEEALAKVKLIQDGVMLSHKPPDGFQVDVVDLLAWVANFFASTGYFEKGLALYQALVEFNLFPPENVSKSQLRALFEVFWDSRCPRVGEKDATGWAETMKNPGAPGDELALRDVAFEDLEDKLANDEATSRAEKWLAIENARCEWHWLPWNSRREDDDVEDRDRIVSFDDVAPFLFSFEARELKFKLFANFLVFLAGFVSCPFFTS
jgi:hypothetical protein